MLSALTDKGELIGYPIYRDCILQSCTLFGVQERIADLSSAVNFCADCESTLVKRIAESPEEDPTCEESLFLSFMLKKWRFSTAQGRSCLQDEAVSGFIERNRRASTLRLPDGHTIDRMRTILRRWLPPVGIQAGRFGPGAVAERYSLARRWEVLSPYLCDSVYCSAELSEPQLIAASPGDRLFDHRASRLCAVPKQWNKMRLITVEPAFRSFLQQGARSTLYASIAAGPLRGSAYDVGVDGASIQRSLALRGSLTGDLATIDLSDASDNITWEFVQTVFPDEVVLYLEQCRSPICNAPDGSSFPLHIYAGMGNATTFVVESLLFGAYVAAISWRHGLKCSRPSVFGDDIICESRLFPYLLEAGDDFFRINTGKSFARPQPGLRESCGIYAYFGRDVTPLRINGFPKGDAGVQGLTDTVQSNWDHHLPYRVRYAHALGEAGVQLGILANLPYRVDGGLGTISVPSLPYTSVPTRYNQQLQRREAKVRVLEGLKVEVPSDRPWFLAGSLLGLVETGTTKRRGSTISFPLRGRYRPVRKRWMPCY
jgi:hypothetical protein